MFKLSLCLIAALIVCAQANYETDVEKSEQSVEPNGFDYTLTLKDGTYQQASGHLAEKDALVQDGKFGWVAPDGTHVEIKYTADEHGYHPSGDLLPTPPPIPEEIVRALKFLEEHGAHE